MPTFSRALAAPIAAVLVVTSAPSTALAADLPFTIPALADPMTGSSTGETPVRHPGSPTPLSLIHI